MFWEIFLVAMFIGFCFFSSVWGMGVGFLFFWGVYFFCV